MLTDCPKSSLEGLTYEDAIILAEKRGKDIDECNKQLGAIRKWKSH